MEEASSVLSERDLSAAIGSTVQGADGEKIGTVESFFVDDRTGAPTWVAVSTGLFGTRHSIVPATQAAFDDGVLSVPVHKDAVRHAPAIGGDHLGPEDEAALREHYGLTGAGGADAAAARPWTAAGSDGRDTPGSGGSLTAGTSGQTQAAGGAATSGASTAGDVDTAGAAAGTGTALTDEVTRPVPQPAAGMRTTTDQAGPPPSGEPAGRHAAAAGTAATDGAMTRSEEQLRVGTERVAATRVRVVKYVVTEEVQVTVPIRREEIRIEEVPLDAPDSGVGGSLAATGTGGGLPAEIVLHAERPVVGVEVVPVERVRLRVEVVAGEERITDQVRREEIAVDHTPAQPR
jgi:uncharacterized protein (TIGR02271 family)